MSMHRSRTTCLKRLSLKAPRNWVAVIPQNERSRHNDSGRSVAAVDGASLMNVSVRILGCRRLLICSRMTVTAGALQGAGIVRRGPAGVTPRCIRVQAKFLWNYHAGHE